MSTVAGPIAITVGTNGSVSGGTTFNGSKNNQLILNSTSASVSGTVQMYKTITDGANFLTVNNGQVTAAITVGQGVISIGDTTNKGDSKIQSSIITNSGNAYWRLSGAAFSTTNGIVIAGADYDEIEINNTTTFDADTKILSSGDESFIYMHDAVVNGNSVVGGFAGAIDMDAKTDTLYIGKDANFMDGATATVKSSVAGTTNTVAINTANGLNSGNYKVEGTIDFSAANAADATNTVYIASGYIHAEDAMNNTIASIKGAGTGGTVTYRVSGGQTSFIDTNSGVGHYVFTGGQVYNIQDTTKVNKIDLNLNSTASYNGGVKYSANTILNQGNIVLNAPAAPANKTILTIGAAPDLDSAYLYQSTDLSSTTYAHNDHWNDNQAQITANRVDVNANAKLIIHENYDRWNIKEGDPGFLNDDRNIVNTMNISGEVTIDRTSIHSNAPAGTPAITVENGGVLRGFAVWDNYATNTNNHDPIRMNLYGDLLLKTGATLQPWDKELFRFQPDEDDTSKVERLMGVVFGASADTEFKQASILSTRLFAIENANPLSVDSGTQKGFYSDSLHTNEATFTSVWDGTKVNGLYDNPIYNKTVQFGQKVQYKPVFGFHDELKSKQQFEIYHGDGDPNDNTYYFNVAKSKTVIEELYKEYGSGVVAANKMPDANHLFNRLILKSDMLGEYSFLSTDDSMGIVLRYRLLAEHPTKGGFVVNETERNNILPGKYLDEIRYPFQTDSSMLNLPSDYAGDIAGLPTDNSSATSPSGNLIYNNEGYDGDMVEWYKKNHASIAAIDNYRNEWIEDWAELLQGFQLELASGRGMRRGLRMLHAESYANLSESNFNVMSQFIRNRERNAVSAMYQVERNDHRDPDYEDVGDVIDAGENERHINMFVENPVRFWAAGFGSEGTQKSSGNEYGYDTEIWGGSLGAIKEYRDLYFGATIGYARAKNSWDEMPSKGTTNSYLAEALVGARLFNWGFVELHGNYSYGQQEMNRVINLGGSYYNGWARGKFNDHLFGGGLRVGYQKLMGGWVFMPTLGVQVMHYRNGSFTEVGRKDMSSLMKFEDGSMNRTVAKTPLILRLSRSFTVGGNVLTPEIRTGVTPILGSTRGKARAEWIGNPFSGRQFTSYGADRGRYEVEAGATLELTRRGRFYLAGSYDYVYSKKSHMHNYSVQTGLNF